MFTPGAVGARTASVSVTDNATGSPQTALLSGNGLAELNLNPTALDFGPVNLGTSAVQTVAVTNVSPANVKITSVDLGGANPGDFTQTNTCGTKLAGNAACTITVTFKPQVAGDRGATITLTDGDPTSPQVIALTGTGVSGAMLTFSPPALSFGNQVYGQPSAPLTTVMTNTGSAALNLTSLGLTGPNSPDFSQANTCGSSLPQGQSCSITVTFTPAGIGARTASLSVTDNAAGSPQTVSLTGTGLPAITVSPAALNYGTVGLGSSASQSVTLSNASAASVSIAGLSFSGSNAGDFSQTNTCAGSVPSNASCTVAVSFNPQASGPRSAILTISDSDPTSPQTVSLTGTGGAGAGVTFSPASVSFGNDPYLQPSAPAIITMTNTGGSALNISSIAVGANVADFNQMNNCGPTLGAGASCTITAVFTPQGPGTRTASIAVTDNGSGSPQTVPLSGTETPALMVSPAALNFGTIAMGSTSVQTVTVQNLSTASISLNSIIVGGANAGDFIQTNTCNSVIPGNGACTITVSFTPPASGARSGTLLLTDADPSSPQLVNLSGTGASSAVVTFSPASLSFGSQIFLTPGAALTTTMTNTGGSPLSIVGSGIAGANIGDFLATNNCGSTLAAGASCVFNITFNPKAAGIRTASLSIADNAAGSPQAVSLTGTGLSAISLSQSNLDFGPLNVGNSSVQTVTVTNLSIASITFKGFSLGGANPGNFSQSNTCGSILAGNASCTLTVIFTPLAAGPLSAAITVANFDPGSSQILTLSGTGLAGGPFANLSPTSLNFGTQVLGVQSAALSTTLTNTGNATLNIADISGLPGAGFYSNNNCGPTLAQGASCIINLIFIPLGVGPGSAVLNITDDAPGSPQTLALTGTGTALQFNPPAVDFGTVNVLTNSSQPMILTNISTSPVPLTTLSFVGANPGDFSETDNCPVVLDAGAACNFTMTFTPQASGSRSGSMKLKDADPASPQLILLTGIGQ